LIDILAEGGREVEREVEREVVYVNIYFLHKIEQVHLTHKMEEN
jgi:hypothetical protein